MAHAIGAFRSKRLIYQAVENNEETHLFLLKLFNDPLVAALSTAEVLRPRSKADAEISATQMKDCLLAVTVCLPVGADELSREAATRPEPAKVIPIGFVLLSNAPSGNSYRHHHRTTELSISLESTYHGKGYGSEAIDWALDWAFRRANMHSVSLFCVEYNVNARKAYEKAGFILSGRMREVDWADRKWHDVLLYSILEREWEQLRGLA